jgi:anion transporter
MATKAGQFDIWALADTAPKKSKPPSRRLRWVVDAITPLSLIIAAGVFVMLPTSLSTAARLTLFAFTLAVILWSTTSLNAAHVALLAVMLMVLSGGGSQEQFVNALASDVIWLMIGAFILGGAVQHTGLAARLTQFVVARARTVRGVFWLLTGVLIPLSVIIPSTSGRAAIATPIFRSLVQAAGDRRITRALALLMPTVILVATIGSLIGAGSHLISIDLLDQIAERRISFAAWMLYGLPLAIVASFVACWLIVYLFLDKTLCDQALQMPARTRTKISPAEWKTLLVIVLMVGFWLSEHWHGFEIAVVTMAGALLLTLPGVGVLPWKNGIKAVSWDLIIFVGAALVLGRSLIESGAADWIIEHVFALSGIMAAESYVLIMLLLSFITLTSHIYMTSHAARAVALTPAVLYLAESLQLNPVTVVFIATVGMDYCLTFPVSSKALLMFQDLDGETYQPADLLRLSSVLLPIHMALIVAFYYGYWRWIGLGLGGA